jgi:1-acyl-sn-glycerol-3-phosphate acyltransferase
VRAWRGARRVLRLSFVLLATGILTVTWFIALPFCAFSPGARRAVRGFVFSHWARACLAGFGVRLRVHGEPPRERSFLVANHVSYLDILVIASRLNCVFVSMAEVIQWPLIGMMARSFGTVFIDRTKKRDILAVNRAMESFLEQGFIVVLFPEGRSSRGERVEPFRPSLLEPAAHGRHPVASATLRYSTGPNDAPASRIVCWTEPGFLSHALRLFLNDRVDAELTYHPEIVRDADRKKLAESVRARVQAQFRPLD